QCHTSLSVKKTRAAGLKPCPFKPEKPYERKIEWALAAEAVFSCGRKAASPQRLKPRLKRRVFGTAEAVPLQNKTTKERLDDRLTAPNPGSRCDQPGGYRYGARGFVRPLRRQAARSLDSMVSHNYRGHQRYRIFFPGSSTHALAHRGRHLAGGAGARDLCALLSPSRR